MSALNELTDEDWHFLSSCQSKKKKKEKRRIKNKVQSMMNGKRNTEDSSVRRKTSKSDIACFKAILAQISFDLANFTAA